MYAKLPAEIQKQPSTSRHSLTYPQYCHFDRTLSEAEGQWRKPYWLLLLLALTEVHIPHTLVILTLSEAEGEGPLYWLSSIAAQSGTPRLQPRVS
jgi:hypothetical protein